MQKHTHFPVVVRGNRREFSSVLPSSPPDRRRSADEADDDDTAYASHPPAQEDRDLGTIFRSWSGNWRVRRAIHHDSSGKKGVDGTFEGTATFLSRAPSAPEPEAGMLEYLYREHGTFTAATGVSFPAQMKYIYQYHFASNRISVWRVKSGASAGPADEGEVESWFHDITLEAPSGAEGKAWFADYRGAGDSVAKGTEHLCIRDRYKPYYRFCFQGDGLSEFGIGYDVRGPEKGYVSEAWFERAE